MILDGSVVERFVLVEAGSTIYPRSNSRSGFVYAGSPAAEIRELGKEEQAERRERIHQGIAASLFSTTPNTYERSGSAISEEGFVASTVHISGHVDLRPRSSVFFSCLLDAKHGSIVLRDNSNIQDNTHIHCSEDGVFIGRETTIGHNVHMLDCRIGDRSLVGIGSVIQSGTIIDDDVLLAAGSRTQPGQHLEGDWLWAGRSARRISKLNHTKRTMMRAIIEQYCAYGDAYRELQTRITR